ncbi:MTH538 TIR-like domain [Paenibacillus sp. 1_12]|uniref:TIR domain-containing protein n=1 Tax=Paenibacillus sp. 1_12 TaxID=1566278 RepID=UPI0008DF9AF5|nr:TIR domain-containing protein [Paenibacillus sp. 1_12]SFM12455.1 MTH538 TIR-like domain [Paenibacillus sp. 1_12]
MARKTFVSYKYSEAKGTRDRIIEALGDDARYYQGETSASPDLTDRKTDTIRNHLKEMIFDTSVTIVVISPNIKLSKWIDWELEYSLKNITREDRTSGSNGIVGVIQEVNGSTNWIEKYITTSDGCRYRYLDKDLLYEIINKNRFNRKTPEFTCPQCETVDTLEGSYIALINEKDFLSEPEKYIENAYEKSKRINEFNITKTVKKDLFSFW